MSATKSSIEQKIDRTTEPVARPRRVLVTGATGFLGRALALRLARDGHQVSAWVRSRERARAALGVGPELVDASAASDDLRRAVESADAVIHLAGEPLFGRRWSDSRKRELRVSRIETTRALVNAMRRAERRPTVLISGSAVGWYGARDDGTEIDEGASAGSGFLAELCREWEDTAREAEKLGVRVATIRTGIVLDASGGALATMLPPFLAGAGGRLGGGRQWMPWIHIEDWIELVVRALDDSRFAGPFNACAPVPVTNAEFTRELGRALQRPTLIPAPGFAIRAALGEVADVLLTGQRAIPRRAEELGFTFRFRTLDAALAEILCDPHGVTIERALDAPEVPYLREHPARYVLTQRTLVPAPLERVFEFFSRAENLGALTPASMGFTVVTPTPIEMREGCEIDYRIKIGPLPLRWRSRIDAWEPGVRFVDSQLVGPYSSWWHEHRFERVGEATQMTDRVWYAPPLGPLGRLANNLTIARQLRSIFVHRARAIALRFGAPRGKV